MIQAAAIILGSLVIVFFIRKIFRPQKRLRMTSGSLTRSGVLQSLDHMLEDAAPYRKYMEEEEPGMHMVADALEKYESSRKTRTNSWGKMYNGHQEIDIDVTETISKLRTGYLNFECPGQM